MSHFRLKNTRFVKCQTFEWRIEEEEKKKIAIDMQRYDSCCYFDHASNRNDFKWIFELK